MGELKQSVPRSIGSPLYVPSDSPRRVPYLLCKLPKATDFMARISLSFVSLNPAACSSKKIVGVPDLLCNLSVKFTALDNIVGFEMLVFTEREST